MYTVAENQEKAKQTMILEILSICQKMMNEGYMDSVEIEKLKSDLNSMSNLEIAKTLHAFR